MNEAIKPARNLHFFQGLILFVIMERDRYVKYRNEASKWNENGYTLTPVAHEILHSIRVAVERENPQVEPTNEDRIKVETANESHTDTLTSKTCTCGVPSIDGEPCVHVYAAAKRRGLSDAETFPHDYFTVERWLQQFPSDGNFGVVTTNDLKMRVKEEGLLNEGDHNLALPITSPPPKGRPRKQRRMLSSMERHRNGKRRRCSKCGGMNHNKRTCTQI